jgi:MFS family permease
MWILQILLIWLAWDVTGSASFVGMIGAFALFPTVLSGPLFGVAVDRMNIRIAAYCTNLGMVLVALTLLAVQGTGALDPVWLSAIAAALGIVKSAHHPVRLSMGPRLVERGHVASVVALTSLNFNLARIVAPIFAGFSIEHAGVTPTLVVAVLLYVPTFVILAFLHPRDTREHGNSVSFSSAFWQGLAYLWHKPDLRAILFLSFLFALAIRGVMEVLPVVADGQFARGATGVGQLGSAIGAGALVAALIKALGRADGRGISIVTLASAALGVLAVAAFGNTEVWGLVMVSAIVLGFTSTTLGVSLQTAIQSDLPDDLRGRVMSIWIVVGLGGAALGSLVIGALSDLIGFSQATLVMSGVSLAGLFILVASGSVEAKRKGG